MQICVSAPPQLQRGHGHFHQLDSAYNEQLLHQTGPNETCPAPGMGAEMAKISSMVKNMHYSIHVYRRRHSDFGCESLVENLFYFQATADCWKCTMLFKTPISNPLIKK